MRIAYLLSLSVSVFLAVPAAADAPVSDTTAGPPSFRLAEPFSVASSDLVLGSGDDTGPEAVTILKGALLGGLAGGVIGLGIALIENGNWARDIGLGAGIGVVIGAGVGAIQAFSDVGPLPASDGLGSTDRNPVIQARTLRLAGRF